MPISNKQKQKIRDTHKDFFAKTGFTKRGGQNYMIGKIASHIAQVKDNKKKNICVIEAGTGIGKTVAYMLPTIILAKDLNKILVISTANIALQQQITSKDLPLVKTNSKLDISWLLVKGRKNYLCLLKAEKFLDDAQGNLLDTHNGKDEGSLANSMWQALSSQTWDGDKESWHKPVEDFAFSKLTSNQFECLKRRCRFINQCPYYKMRNQIKDHDIIVTNHAFVISDALTGSEILGKPEDIIYIFDEGHQLEETTVNLNRGELAVDFFRDWLTQSGQFFQQLVATKNLPKGFDITEINNLFEQLLDGSVDIRQNAFKFLDADIKDFDNYQQQLKPLAEIALNLIEPLQDSLKWLFSVIAVVEKKLEDEINPNIKLANEQNFLRLKTIQQQLESWLKLCVDYAKNDEPDKEPIARWVSETKFSKVDDLVLCSSPVIGKHLLQQQIWEKCYAAIICSATLADQISANPFEYFCHTTGIEYNEFFYRIPSPFNYQRIKLNIPTNLQFQYQNEEYKQRLTLCIESLIKNHKSTLVLFAARKLMNDVYENIADNSSIQMQGNQSRSQTVEQHKQLLNENKTSVIFGLSSFSEGIDLVGELLTQVIIIKIPFSQPDDPILATYSNWLSNRGENPFNRLLLPKATMKLIQATGRLVRSETDTGEVWILDSRMILKYYGNKIINSLPPYTLNKVEV